MKTAAAKDTKAPSYPLAERPEGNDLAIAPAAFRELAERLRARSGLNLLGYKERYARRRIAVRLRARRCPRLENYLQLLEREPAEWDHLVAALSINVSSFFRNPETFAVIGNRLLPQAIQWRKRHQEPRLRLWSAGCAEGEEAYSLAIVLREDFPGPLATMAVSILATDIDEDSLALARAGLYPESRLSDLPPGLRDKHFRPQEGRWKIRRRIVSRMSFARLDLLSQAGPPDLDLIVCRNVLIYLSREEQERILAGFYRSLRPEGFVVLGKTESLVGGLRRSLLPVLPRERIYQKPPAPAGRALQEVRG